MPKTWSENKTAYTAKELLDTRPDAFDTAREEYAQDFADETGILSDVGGWPFTCIDWEQAARELQYDYSSVELDGETYWFLSC